MHCRRTLFALFFFCFGTLLTLGCVSPSDEHAEHQDPPHRPASFVDAVARLQAISDGEAEGQTVVALHPSGDVQRETVDLLLWLPELSADSDLSREDWEKCYQATESIRAQAASWKASNGTSDSPDALNLDAELKSVLPELQRCAKLIREQQLAIEGPDASETPHAEGEDSI